MRVIVMANLVHFQDLAQLDSSALLLLSFFRSNRGAMSNFQFDSLRQNAASGGVRLERKLRLTED